MDNIRLLKVQFSNLPIFKDGEFAFDFTAADRVCDYDEVYAIKNANMQKIIGIVGINASGKTTALKLLNMAARIVINNQDLNDPSLSFCTGLLHDGTEMVVHFLYRLKIYRLQSVIGVNEEPGAKIKYFFAEETLSCKELSKAQSKKELLSFSERNSKEITTRSKLPADQSMLLKEGVSISIQLTRQNRNIAESMISSSNFNIFLPSISPSTEELGVFDPSLERIDAIYAGDSGNTYNVKFKNGDSSNGISAIWLSMIVSSGTIKGCNILAMIKNVLKKGGYLFVDEMENHMNKELVKMIMDIFRNPSLNKDGACLVFSTHYPELLDSMGRKDNIYVMRKSFGDRLLECLNYSKEIKRNDVKKSEVILSNAIKGTAPSYESIMALEEYLCREIWPTA